MVLCWDVTFVIRNFFCNLNRLLTKTYKMKKLANLLMLFGVLILIYGCQSNKTETDLNANREVVLKYFKIWSSGEIDKLNEVIAPDFVCHFIGGIEWIGIEGVQKSISDHRKSFPDWSEEVVDIIAEGNKVVTRFKSKGTHKGAFLGIDSAGNKIEIFETCIYRIENGKIVEQWGFPDISSLKAQLMKTE